MYVCMYVCIYIYIYIYIYMGRHLHVLEDRREPHAQRDADEVLQDHDPEEDL